MQEHKYRAQALTGELVYFALHESQFSGDSEIFYTGGIPCKVGTEQQFVYIKDVKGKDVYEGDIVSIPYYKKCRNFIVKELSKYGIILDYPNGSIEFWDRTANKREMTVTGNIHENPELLKEV